MPNPDVTNDSVPIEKAESMIENERQLRHALTTIVKMYGQSEREAGETTWDAETRSQMSEDTDAMRLRQEREVAQFLAEKHGCALALGRVL